MVTNHISLSLLSLYKPPRALVTWPVKMADIDRFKIVFINCLQWPLTDQCLPEKVIGHAGSFFGQSLDETMCVWWYLLITGGRS